MLRCYSSSSRLCISRLDSDVKLSAPAVKHHDVCVTTCDVTKQTMQLSTDERSNMTSLMRDVNASRRDSAVLTSTADTTRDMKQLLASQAGIRTNQTTNKQPYLILLIDHTTMKYLAHTWPWFSPTVLTWLENTTWIIKHESLQC